MRSEVNDVYFLFITEPENGDHSADGLKGPFSEKKEGIYNNILN